MTASASSIRVVPAADGQAVPGVGKYRYIAMLAEGGMADVYLAVTHLAGFEKLVVIKQLRDALAVDPTFVNMFMDEARLAARLNHPNVVQTLEVGTDPTTNLHFIAMEFLEGVAYVRFARLKDRVPPPLAFHLRILVDVLRGLHYAHELRDFDGKPLNVVHRDVSPQNVMLTFAGGVKVLDFGIAKAALAAEQRPEDFKGKLEYMAPEQARTEVVDRRADVFSVGVMLFEALTRRRLYRKGEDKFELLTTGNLPNVLDIAPTTPKRLAAICAKAMAHDKSARYATADAMADEIEDWLGSTTQHVSARDVGSFVADKFSSTRNKIGAAIEAQLTLFRALPEEAPDTLPISKLPGAEIPPDLSEPPPPISVPPAPISVPPGGMLPPPVASNPSLPNGWTTSDSGSNGFVGTALMSGSQNAITVPPQTRSRSAPHSSSKSSSGTIIAVVALSAVVLLGGFVAFAAHKRKKASPVETASAQSLGTVAVAAPGTGPPSNTTAPPVAPGTATDEAQIELTIKAFPPEAKISVDGKPLDANPATGKRPRDGAMHLVRIEAPGYDPREESIGFDRSVFVTIELRPTPAQVELPGTPIKGSGRRFGPATPRPGPGPRGHATPGVKLDSENPYQ